MERSREPFETPSRRLRRRVLSWLPTGPRTRLRRLYERRAAPAARATATFVNDGATVVVSMANGPVIRILPECRADIERQFTDPKGAAELSRFMRAAAVPGVLFDVGANHGLFSLVFCLINPGNRAVAFEPSPRLADNIRRLAVVNQVGDRLDVVAKAVAETSGVRDLLLDERGGYVQSEAFAGTTHGAWQTVAMPLITLDECLPMQSPTLVKIDVEGYEGEALAGAERLLTVTRPTIFLELHLNYLQARQLSPARVLRQLADRGYRLTDLAGGRVSEGAVTRSWASVLHLVATPEPD